MSLDIKPVPSLPGVLARSDGYVKMPDDLKPTKFRPGSVTSSSKNAKHKYYSLRHRRLGQLKVLQLVCEAFNGPRPSEFHGVSHKNENALDNRACNLGWSTQKENLNMPNFINYCKSRLRVDSPVVKGRL